MSDDESRAEIPYEILHALEDNRDKVIQWLNLEESAGELTPGLAELRDWLEFGKDDPFPEGMF